MLDLASFGDGPWLMPIVGISAKEASVATDMPAIGINGGTLADCPKSDIKPIATHPPDHRAFDETPPVPDTS
jgi:hypothetical protein